MGLNYRKQLTVLQGKLSKLEETISQLQRENALLDNDLRKLRGEKNAVTVELIHSIVFKYYPYSWTEIVSKKVKKELSLARQIHMYFMRKYCDKTNSSYHAIGLVFGVRDHSTTYSAIKKITGLIRVDKKFAVMMANIDHSISKQLQPTIGSRYEAKIRKEVHTRTKFVEEQLYRYLKLAAVSYFPGNNFKKYFNKIQKAKNILEYYYKEFEICSTLIRSCPPNKSSPS